MSEAAPHSPQPKDTDHEPESIESESEPRRNPDASDDHVVQLQRGRRNISDVLVSRRARSDSRVSMANKQPFYHRMEVLFTATKDVSAIANTFEFRASLAVFLQDQLGKTVRTESVTFDAPVDAEPGDPNDLM